MLLWCAVCCVLQTTSEKALRKQLQTCFKTDMAEKKAFIKEHVSCSPHILASTKRARAGMPSRACAVHTHCRHERRASCWDIRVVLRAIGSSSNRVL